MPGTSRITTEGVIQGSPLGVSVGGGLVVRPSPNLPDATNEATPNTLVKRNGNGQATLHHLLVETITPQSGFAITIQGNTVTSLGNVSGLTEIDISLGCVFTATLVGNTTFAVVGEQYGLLVFDLTQGNLGGYTIAFNGAGGHTVVDPSGVLAQIFVGVGVGARSVGLWQAAETTLYAMGYNASP